MVADTVEEWATAGAAEMNGSTGGASGKHNHSHSHSPSLSSSGDWLEQFPEESAAGAAVDLFKEIRAEPKLTNPGRNRPRRAKKIPGSKGTTATSSLSSGTGMEFSASGIDQDRSAGVDEFFRAMPADGAEKFDKFEKFEKFESVKEEENGSGGWELVDPVKEDQIKTPLMPKKAIFPPTKELQDALIRRQNLGSTDDRIQTEEVLK